MERMKMIEEKMEQKEKKKRKNNVIITGIGGIRGNIQRRMEERLEREIGVKVNVKEAFRINKDDAGKNRKLGVEEEYYAKNKSKLEVRKELTNQERKTQKKLREVVRKQRDRGKRVKIRYSRRYRSTGNGLPGMREGRNLRQIFRRRREEEKIYKEKMNKKGRWTKKTETRKEAQKGKSLSKEYIWEGQGAKREKKKGRATGGITTGVKLDEKREKKKNA
jgi:hypothetical protein